MDEAKNQIKEKIDLVEYISQFAEVKQSGKNFKALCPFHSEHTPSFVISPERQIWRCFGSCNEGGDIFSFYMKWEGVGFVEALQELAKEVGVTLEVRSHQDTQYDIKNKIYEINMLAAKYFSYILNQSKIGNDGREYLKDRGIDEKLMKTFELGYAPSSWRSLYSFLIKKKFSREEIIQSGLVLPGKSSDSAYDRFRGRVVFPIRDHRNNIIGFSGRALKDAKGAKYINVPETPVYKKRQSLYGIHLAKDAIRKENNVFLTEGEFDVITIFKHGTSNVVAIKGSTVTEDQLKILKRYTNKITFALDADSAGQEAIRLGIQQAEKFGFDIQIILFASGKDPDEAANTDLFSFKKSLTSPIPMYDYILNKLEDKHPMDTPYGKKTIVEEFAPYLNYIQNPVVKSHYIQYITKRLQISQRSLYTFLREKSKRDRYQPKTTKKANEANLYNDQKLLLGYLFQQEKPKKITNEVFSTIQPDDLITPALEKLARQFLEYITHASSFSFPNFVHSLPTELSSLADELYLLDSVSDHVSRSTLHQIILRIKSESLKKKIQQYSKLKKLNEEEERELQVYNHQLRELRKNI